MQQAFTIKTKKILLLALLQWFALLPVYAANNDLDQVPTKPHRIVASPALKITPDTLEMASGTQITLSAKPTGGEAILFAVDWSIREGESGGHIEPGIRNSSGAIEATYFSPGSGLGPFHVEAKLHEYPSATAKAVIYIVPAH